MASLYWYYCSLTLFNLLLDTTYSLPMQIDLEFYVVPNQPVSTECRPREEKRSLGHPLGDDISRFVGGVQWMSGRPTCVDCNMPIVITYILKLRVVKFILIFFSESSKLFFITL